MTDKELERKLQELSRQNFDEYIVEGQYIEVHGQLSKEQIRLLYEYTNAQ